MLKFFRLSLNKKKYQQVGASLFIVAIAITGTILVQSSHASAPYAIINADSGKLAGSATLQTCSEASDGKCVTFGNSQTAGCALSTFTSTNQPSCWVPYSSSSPFNTPLPANPTLVSAADNAAFQSHVSTYQWGFLGGDSGGSKFIIQDVGSRPIYFANTSDPLMTIKCTSEYGGNGCTGNNGVDINGMQIHIPAGANPTSNGDSHMIVVEVNTGLEFDMLHTSVSGSTITMGTGSEDNTQTGFGINDQGTASGISELAGLLRPSELLSGKINHALTIDIPCSSDSYVYPANGPYADYCGEFFSESQTGAPANGQLLMLDMTPAQIADSGAPAWEQTVMTAMANYGAYVEDTQGSWDTGEIDIFQQDPASWTDLGVPDQWASTIKALGGTNGSLTSNVPIPMSKMVIVNACVAQKNC
jgi:hypothetical protein